MSEDKKITELTEEQKALIPEWREKWIKIGLDTTPADKPVAEKWIKQAYKDRGYAEPKEVLWFESPVAILDFLKENGYSASTGISSFCYGSHDASWLGFYDYFLKVCEVEEARKLESLIELSKVCGWWIPYTNYALASEKPVEININEEMVLHKDGGPAITFKDGFSVYALNGIRVPKEIAETPFDELDPKLVLTEENAEVKREVVRKIGVERLIGHPDFNTEVIDKFENYELLLLDIEDVQERGFGSREDSSPRRRPYLKMLNPSIGTWHVEGVHPDCKTVRQALAWRNGHEDFSKPQKLT